MKKRILSLLCSLAMLVAMLPVSAFAADASWADSAVSALDEVYGSGVFSADGGEMTHGDAKTIAASVGWSTYKIDSDTETTLTRSDACEVLADVFDLPVTSDQTAIEYLYGQNIISGTADGTLNETGSVSFAEFAVLTYRVLNAVGGGMGSKENWPEPGSKGYTAWMYLAVRKCVPFEMDAANTPIKDATVQTYTGSVYKENDDRETIDGGKTEIYDVTTADKKGQDIWDAWEDALQDPNLGGDFSFVAPEYAENETLLDAAIRMVAARNDASPVIFHDVITGNWFYDGIMYLVNNDIVIGYGDGKFGPNDIAPRYELAVLLANVEGVTLTTDSNPGRIIDAIKNAVNKGYMTGTVPENSEENPWNPGQDTYWSQPTTREEATVALLKMIANKEHITTTNNNLTILERFTDAGDIVYDAFKPYLAYAVSVGLLSGTSANTLDPDGKVSRAQIGVLLYRTLIGLDETKMKDYADNVSASLQNSAVAALLSLPVQRAETTVVKTLTLREDWRLTSDLDLEVPAGTELTINGAGHHIYEMGGRLLNSGAGTVTFASGTILYPAGGASEGVTVNGTWDTEESNALMTARQSGSSGGGSSSGGGGGGSSSSSSKPSASVSGSGGKVEAADDGTVTITPDEGYRIDSITINGEEIQIPTDGKLTGLDKDDEVVVTFVKDTISVIGPFADVSVDAWYADAVQYVYEKGMMNGTGENSFSPDETTTRGMIVTMLYRLENEPAASASAFTDVAAGSWYADAVAWAAEQGVVNGVSDTAFAPDTAITREQMAAILYRYAQRKGYDVSVGEDTNILSYTDAASISEYAIPAMQWACGAGLITGDTATTLNPLGNATRAEVATILMRFLEQLAE